MFKSFIDLVNEAAEKNDLYYQFKTNQSFRFKIVNMLAKNGYLVHGTNSNFDKFDSEKIKGGSRASYGYGAYFTNAAYKCEEYGNEFIFLDANGFNFIELDDPVPDNNIFRDINKKIEYLNMKISEYRENSYNAVNIRDYDYYEKELKKYKLKLKSIVPDEKYEIVINLFSKKLSSDKNITYGNLIKSVTSAVSNFVGISFIPNFFIKLGYDGYHSGSEFVIFNFTKLNDNIVKNKEKLIEEMYEQINNI